MNSKVFLNLPVDDVNRSKLFFEKLGFEFNKDFGNENSVCMVLNESTSVMLTSRAIFEEMIPKSGYYSISALVFFYEFSNIREPS